MVTELAKTDSLLLSGVGNPLVDYIVHCEPAFMHSLGFAPGSINHVSRILMESILGKLPAKTRVAGGGSANTCRIASMLGADCMFAGAIGDDALGGWYRAQLEGDGVRASLQEISSEGTGVFCTFIHGPGMRSLVVAPGAALHFDASGFDPAILRRGGILHAEGFLAGDPEFLSAVFTLGAAAGMSCSLDLGSAELVRSRREEFRAIVEAFCDTVFADESEFAAFSGIENIRDAASSLPADTLFVVKMGERGACSLREGEITEGRTRVRVAVDETGAGDTFAAAFLCASAAGLDEGECLERANRLAGLTVLVPGMGLSAREAREAFFA
jgi:ribokinase